MVRPPKSRAAEGAKHPPDKPKKGAVGSAGVRATSKAKQTPLTAKGSRSEAGKGAKATANTAGKAQKPVASLRPSREKASGPKPPGSTKAGHRAPKRASGRGTAVAPAGAEHVKAESKRTAPLKREAKAPAAKSIKARAVKTALQKARADSTAASTRRKPIVAKGKASKKALPRRNGAGSDPVRAGRTRTRDRKQPPPAYLAAELGQPVDQDGEPIGAGSVRVRSDKELQEYTLQLWRQMQRGGLLRPQVRSMERAGLTIDDVWAASMTGAQPTSSTEDEMRRYRQKVLFRANLLEAILTETVADLHRLEGIEPIPSKTAGGSNS